jgi:large subunit ribosomal protein L9
MEVILREAIDNLGHAGDCVHVRPGYARNYLLPRKLAYLATHANLKIMEQERANLLRREAKQRGEAEKLRDMIGGTEITVKRRVGEQEVLYGSVTTSDIAEELQKKGFTVDRRKIGLDDHIKQLGEFTIPIRLFTDVIAEVKLSVEPEENEATPPAEAKPEGDS